MTDKIVLDENGNPVMKKTVLDDQGNMIVKMVPVPQSEPTDFLTKTEDVIHGVAGAIGRTVIPTITEGGPAAVCAIIGGAMGGPPGAVLGGMGGELGRQLFRRYAGGGPAPTSNTEAITQQLLAGAAGAATPESAALLNPGAAAAERVGARIPPRMTTKEAQQVVDYAPARRVEIARQVRQEVQPLKQERQQILNARTATSASLAEKRTAINEAERASKAKLRMSSAQAKQAAESAAAKDAETFASSIGKQMTDTEIARGTVAARSTGWHGYTDKVTKLYNEIRDDIFTKNVSTVPTGKMKPTGILGPNGEEIMEEETKTVLGAIDRTRVKENLRDFVERFREQLAVAKAQGSPGARAALEIVDGPDVVPGAVAIDDMTALNQLGYGKADQAIRTHAEGIARKVGGEYRQALKESIDRMEGGEVAKAKLQEAQKLLIERDSIFRTGAGVTSNRPIAKQVGAQVEASGNVHQYIGNPVKLRAALGQVDQTTRQGMKSQIARSLVGKNFKDFVKNVRNLDPEVAEMVLGPSGKAKAELLITKGNKAFMEIADRTIAENEAIVKEATGKLTAVGKQRMQLGDLTKNQRELAGKITETAKTTSEDLRLAHQIQLREARKRLEEAKALKKKLIIGGAIATTAATSWNTHRIAALLGW